jgi:low temperature requirement protein LtrA
MWLRVAHDEPGARPIALRYAAGVTVVQVLWVARLGFPDGAVGLLSFVALAVAEMAVPYWAENSGDHFTPWHVEHIVERFSLFTIIVLGEVILATTQAISATLDGHGLTWDLTGVITGGLLLVLALWWIYFKRPLAECIRGRNGFVFGYAHYFVLGSVAAIGAGLATCVDVVEHHAHGIGPTTAAVCVAAAVSVYLLALGTIHAYGDRSIRALTAPAVVSALAVAAALLGSLVSGHVGPGVLLTGLVATGAVLDHQIRGGDSTRAPDGAENKF